MSDGGPRRGDIYVCNDGRKRAALPQVSVIEVTTCLGETDVLLLHTYARGPVRERRRYISLWGLESKYSLVARQEEMNV